MATIGDENRLDFSLPGELRLAIETAAAYLGQSVRDFAVSAIADRARDVIQSQHVTRLSNRDRDIFLAMLDDVDLRPNEALKQAAEKYRREIE